MEFPSHHYGWLVSRNRAERVLPDIRLALRRTPLTLEPAVPYGTYIKWLMEQDKEKAASYWERYLEGFEQQTVLPKQKNPAKADKRK